MDFRRVSILVKKPSNSNLMVFSLSMPKWDVNEFVSVDIIRKIIAHRLNIYTCRLFIGNKFVDKTNFVPVMELNSIRIIIGSHRIIHSGVINNKRRVYID